MSVKKLYQDLILDHSTNPRNNKELDFFNRNAEAFNQLCGDRSHVFIKLSDSTTTTRTRTKTKNHTPTTPKQNYDATQHDTTEQHMTSKNRISFGKIT